MTAWRLAADEKPPLHQQVLVELREAVGQVCDVACYLGIVDMDGQRVERWLLADVRMDTRQIKRWAHIYPEPPPNEIKRAFVAGFTEAYEGPEHDCTATAETIYAQEYNR